MTGPTNSDFSRALEALTIFTLWREAGLPTPVPQRDGLCKSPFRDDGRNGSFSIVGGGKGFRDHGGDGAHGGLIDFAKLAWPNLTAEELRERMIEASGIIRSSKKQPGADEGANPQGTTAPAAVPPALLKAAKRIEQRARVAAAEEQIYEQREAELRPQVPQGKEIIPAWPACVEERWNAGVLALQESAPAVRKLAESRGWPIAWAEELVNQGLISYPHERWSDPSDRWAKRQKAFRVDVPVFAGKSATSAELRPVGYHQRFFVPEQRDARGAIVKEQIKGWVYVPSFPKNGPESARSEFERAIVAEGVARKLDAGGDERKPEGFIPPLPFVLGDLNAPRLLVLLEGQWDAITFYGACGWFHDTATPSGVAVMGIRGAQGVSPFLAYWRPWLKINRPLVWVIADNDAAGRAWRDAPAAKPGHLQPPSFAEKLEAAGCRGVLTSWLTPGQWGKDFNDYYRAARPDAVKMDRWMRKVGVMTSTGGWA